MSLRRNVLWSRSLRNFAILLMVDGLLSVATGAFLGILPPTIMADIMFAEGAVLLVAGGISGIFAVSPSLHRVKRHFDDRYDARRGTIVENAPAQQTEKTSEQAEKKPAKSERPSLMIVAWGAVLLTLSTALSIAIILIP